MAGLRQAYSLDAVHCQVCMLSQKAKSLLLGLLRLSQLAQFNRRHRPRCVPRRQTKGLAVLAFNARRKRLSFPLDVHDLLFADPALELLVADSDPDLVPRVFLELETGCRFVLRGI